MEKLKLVHDRTNGWWLLLAKQEDGGYTTLTAISNAELEAAYAKDRKA